MNCLIINDMHPSIHQMMEDLKIDVDYQPDLPQGEIKNVIGNYDGLLVRGKKITKEILDHATKLQFIGRAGAGLDNIDVGYANKKGITLFKAPEGNRDAVAEHTIGLILNLLNKLRTADLEVRSYKWDREGNRGYELGGKTVGIIGYGYMGTAFSKRLSGFNCKVIAYDKYKPSFTNKWTREVDLTTLFEETDILSIHVQLTEETYSMFNYDFFKNFKKNIIVINTSRGEVLVLDDLLKLIEERKIISAGLDVLENEKLNTLTEKQKETYDKLVQHDDIILSPHVGGWSYESHIRINEVLANKIKTHFFPEA